MQVLTFELTYIYIYTYTYIYMYISLMRPASDTPDETTRRQHFHKRTYELEGTHNKKHIQLETLVKTYKGDRTCAKERSATLGPAFRREEKL